MFSQLYGSSFLNSAAALVSRRRGAAILRVWVTLRALIFKMAYLSFVICQNYAYDMPLESSFEDL